jgi:hypothetical protein
MARLYVLSGPDIGRVVDFEGFVTVGRTKECNLVLRDPSISRRHAHLQRTDAGWELVDDDSRNGIVIGGERQARVKLVDGQEFLLGEVLLRFREQAAAEPAVPPEPAPRAPAVAAAPPVPIPRPAPPPTPRTHGAPAASADGLDLEEAHEIDLGASSLGQTRVAAPTASPAPLSGRARDAAFKPAREGLEEQRGRVLQFHRVADSSSPFSFELSQLLLWQRALLVVAALALLAGVAWAAFFGTAFLRGKLGESPQVEDDQPAIEVEDG